MKTSVKHLSKTKVKVTITLGAEELADARQVALHKLARDVKAPGFRKGKVPLSVAEKYVDPTNLVNQTVDDALSKAVSEVFVKEDLRALDRPAVEVTKFVPDETLEFTAEADVLPEVKLGSYKKMGIKKVVEKVTEADVNEVVERMRTGMAEKVDVKRAVQSGDEVVIDFVGKIDGEAFDGGKAEGYTLGIGSKQFIPGFEEGIVSHKAGEDFDVKVKFPKDYHSKTLAGKDAVFSVKLQTVKEVKKPEIDDKFAAKLGPFKTAKEMLADIKREITVGKEREALSKFKDELIEKLVSVSDVDAPEILVEDQMKSIEQDAVQNLAYQGMSLDQYLEANNLTKDEWLEKEVRKSAELRVKSGLVLAELSKVEKVTATNEELAAKVQEYQEQYGKTGQDFTTPEMQRDIANRLLTDKSIDRLVELN